MRSYGEFMEAARKLEDHPAMREMTLPAKVATVLGGFCFGLGVVLAAHGKWQTAAGVWIPAAVLLIPHAIRVADRVRIRRAIRALRNEVRPLGNRHA